MANDARIQFQGCGVLGHFGAATRAVISDQKFHRALDLMAHRGPNGEGLWHEQQLQLGHKRLAIMDQTDSSAQPRETKKSVFCYNGEIYNTRALARQLPGLQACKSDTIVLQAYLDEFGLSALDRVNGMFAFSYWDKSTRSLHLARDRLGIKPLYVFENTHGILFCSEVAPLLELCDDAEIDIDLLREQIMFTSALTDQSKTLIKSIQQFPPGKLHSYNLRNGRLRCAESSIGAFTACEPMAVDVAAARFGGVVGRQQNAETKVGVLLSGGLDSSLIAKSLNNSANCLTAITTVYSDQGVVHQSPDSKVATGLAQQYGWKLSQAICDSTPSTWSIDHIVEPHALSDDVRFLAIYNNYKTAAVQGISVVLNGQGADEIFGGYLSAQTFRMIKNNQFSDLLRHLIQSRMANFTMSPKMHQAHDAFFEKTRAEFSKGDAFRDYMRFYRKTQLRRVLQFEDYFSMHNSVECRVPFLDYEMLAIASHLTVDDLYSDKQQVSKLLLRQIGQHVLQHDIAFRTKSPFPQPPMAGGIEITAAEHSLIRAQLEQSAFLKAVFETNDVLNDIWLKGCKRTRWNCLVLLAYCKKFGANL